MRYFLALFLLSISNLLIAQEYTKLYGNSDSNQGLDLIKTSDNNLLIAGIEGSDAMLMKVDLNGDLLWSKSYGGDNTELFYSVIEDNGFYYMCGSSTSYTVDSISDVFVVKTDLSGNIVWSKTFGGSGCAGAYCGDVGYKIIKESTNKFVIAGRAATNGFNLMAGYIIKIDESGSLVEDYVFDGVGSEFFYSVSLADNGDLLYTGQNKIGNWESWLLRMSPDGSVIYNLGYGDAVTAGVAGEVLESNDYTYVFMGNGDQTVSLLKLDAYGDTVTAKQYQGNSAKYMMISEDNNNLYLLGNTTNTTCYLIKTDLQGDTVWTKHFYSLNGHTLIEKDDHIYILSTTTSDGNGGLDIALMKLASDGTTSNCYEYNFTDFFYNPYNMVITPFNEGLYSLSNNNDVLTNNNVIDYNKCVKCISTDFSYQVNNLEVFFTNESTLEVDYNWDFGDNNFDSNYNTSHQFSSTGSYEVCLLASDSCSSQIVCQTIEITDCQSEQSNTVITTCDSSYQWNGTSYNQSGQYNWSIINSNGCDSTATLNLSISQLETLVIDGEQIGYTETDNNTYSISNSNASSTYFWNLSNNLGTIEIGNANNSEITISWGENDSETTLCVYEQDEYSCEGEESCITIDLKRPTSIDDIEESLLSIYPNPFKNQTTVSFSNPTQSKAILKLIDSRGRTVRNYDGITGDSIIIKKEELPEGLYYIQLNLNNNVIRKHIVIQ